MENGNLLTSAAKEDDWQKVESLISQGSDVNETLIEYDYPTALFIACENERVDAVKLLVQNGACMEITNSNGQTCLMVSCENENPEIIDYLLSQGSRVNRCREMGSTALHVCGDVVRADLLHSLLKSGGILQKDENGCSPIMCGAKAHRLSKHNGHTFLEYINVNKAKLQLCRSFNRAKNNFTFIIKTKHLIAAYELLGACANKLSTLENDVLQAWSTAISIRKEARPHTTQFVNMSPTCICVENINPTESIRSTLQSTSEDPWFVVSLVAREALSGMELLRCARKPDRVSWMPCFSCPTSPYQHYRHFVSYIKLRESMQNLLCHEIYQVKRQQLRMDIQTAYKDLVKSILWYNILHGTTKKQFLPCCQPSQSKDRRTHSGLNYERQDNVPSGCSVKCSKTTNSGVSIQPSSNFDVNLGIEPCCFVQTRDYSNNNDLPSYYLLRHWLHSRCFKDPRTSYRSAYNICTVCGKITIQFSMAYHLHSLDSSLSDFDFIRSYVCKSCIPDIDAIDEQPRKVAYMYLTDKRQRHQASQTVHFQTCDKMQAKNPRVCTRCGLISEQHPTLQRLRLRWTKAFGNMRIFYCADELKEIMSNPDSIQLQKILIIMRHLSLNDVDFIMHIQDSCIRAEDIITRITKRNLYYCISEFQRIFGDVQFRHVLWYFEEFARLTIYEQSTSPDIDLMIEYLQSAIDSIQRCIMRSNNGWHRRTNELTGASWNVSHMLKSCSYFVSEILFHYAFEKPLKGLFLSIINSVTKAHDRIKRYGFHHSEHQFANENCVESDDEMRYKFILQVFRLVCLDIPVEYGYCLLHLSCHLHDVSLLRLFLQLGANPDSIDGDGQTAIGYILQNHEILQKDMITYLDTLMEGGAHLDGYKRSTGCDARFAIFLQEKRICPVLQGRLACLTASFIRHIPLDSSHPTVKHFLPHPLITFLSLH